jgi:hypothetical protein
MPVRWKGAGLWEVLMWKGPPLARGPQGNGAMDPAPASPDLNAWHGQQVCPEASGTLIRLRRPSMRQRERQLGRGWGGAAPAWRRH